MAAATALADSATPRTDCDESSADCVAVGRWTFSTALGAGVRTNPVLHGQDIPLVVVPQLGYFGKYFFLDNLDFGVTFVDSDRANLSLIATPGYDRVFFCRSDLQNLFLSGFPNAASAAEPTLVSSDAPGAVPFPPRARRLTFLAGPEWTFKADLVTGQLDVLHEVTGRNHGTEVRAALAVPLVRSVNSLTASLGLTWKSAAIVNYYYGAPGFYEAGSSTNPFVKLAYARRLGAHWSVDAFVHYESLGNAIADSPIIVRDHVTTAFAGVTYRH